jgi:hypothetical protein
MKQLNTNTLPIEIKDSIEEAPDYKTNGEGFEAAEIIKAIVVRRGTVEGNDTVDIQFQDLKGNKFIAMTTGALIKMLAAAINIHKV